MFTLLFLLAGSDVGAPTSPGGPETTALSGVVRFYPRRGFLIGSTNIIELQQFRDAPAGSYITDGAAVADLLDPAGDPVAGAEAITMTKIAGATPADTVYRCAVPSSVALTDRAEYAVRVVAQDVNGNVLELTVAAPTLRQ